MTPLDRALNLPIWQGTPRAVPLTGGITNVNFLVTDDLRRAVVRIGGDIDVHHIMRFNEAAASCAAYAAGISPEVIYSGDGALVIGYIDGRTMTGADFQNDIVRAEAIDLIARTHRDIPKHLRGAALTFWVFHVLRDYAARLGHRGDIPALMQQARILEQAIGPIDMVFGHNDLLAANFLHDGARMWLIDWDYAGWGSPLFDLGGFAANVGLSRDQETQMLQQYFGAVDGGLQRRYLAMKAAAALREAMWSMVSEIHSKLDFDYAEYTENCLNTYTQAFDTFTES